MKNILQIAQIVISILLITGILLQQRGAALGSAFGGSGGSYFKKRGLEKNLFWATIILATLFVINGILNLLL